MRVGFLGLGVMGTPMAINLAKRYPLTVWNRSSSKYPTLLQAGANVGKTPAEVAEQSDIVFTMLFNGSAIRDVFNDEFKRALRGKVLINCSSIPVNFSQSLADEIRRMGGDYIEMPVSGSKINAEQGRLVGLMAGDPDIIQRVKEFVKPVTNDTIYCGTIGMGLKMKYAVNLFLITMTAGLGEAMNLARAQGLDPEAFGKAIEAGPMASVHSGLKISKMLKEDWSAQAAIADCYNITQLIKSASQESGVQSPIIELCGNLYNQAKQLGLGEEDMIAITKVFPSLIPQN